MEKNLNSNYLNKKNYIFLLLFLFLLKAINSIFFNTIIIFLSYFFRIEKDKLIEKYKLIN
jgi:hypothetical protein